MTKLTYKIVDRRNNILQSGIPTLDEAVATAESLGAKYLPEYTIIREKTHFDRSKCKKSPDWLTRHAN